MKKNNPDSMSMPLSDKESKSLFETIMDAENEQFIDDTIRAVSRRVGLVLKVAHSRKLHLIYNNFIDRIASLMRDTCSLIDNELSPTKED